MGKWLDKYAGSIRFWVLILVSVYLGYTLYFAVYGLQFTLQLTHDHYVYGLVTKNPWWWIILYCGSEGVAAPCRLCPVLAEELTNDKVTWISKNMVPLPTFAAINKRRGVSQEQETSRHSAIPKIRVRANLFGS